MKFNWHQTVVFIFFVGALCRPGFSMGRKQDYQDSPNYAANRVQRGSAANPNAAYAPPHWDAPSNSGAVTPAPVPVTTKLSQPKLKAGTNPDSLPALQQDSNSSASGTVPLRTTPLPPPKATVAPADASEPALPDYPTDDNTNKVNSDQIKNPK